MRSTLHTCFAASVALLAAAAAEAKPCSPNALCVLDAQGRQIGAFAGNSNVLREWKGIYYNFNVSPIGVTEGALLIYESTDCSGTPYIQADNSLPPFAYFDQNKVLWTAGQPTVTTISFQSYLNGSTCQAYPLGPVPAGPATIVDATTPSTWVPPFRVKKIPVIPPAVSDLSE